MNIEDITINDESLDPKVVKDVLKIITILVDNLGYNSVNVTEEETQTMWIKQVSLNAIYNRPIKPGKYIKANAIKCDNERCGWRTEGIGGIETLHYWENVSCPRCGENLLTQKDLLSMRLVAAFARNPLIRFINWFGEKVLHMKLDRVKVTFNGEGKPNFEKI